MPLQIAICDDEPGQTKELSAAVHRWADASGHPCTVRSFPSAEAFLFTCGESNPCDILLLDIEMGEISGIDLAKRIRNTGSRAEIIFITSHFEFAGEGYEVDALHYLTKPVAEKKLSEVMEKAAARCILAPPSVLVYSDGETVKLYEPDILYVEASLHYLYIYTKEEKYCIKESLSSFEARLSRDFFRIHRSYLVSLRHVTKISRNCVTMDGKIELPLARGKYDAIHRAFIERV